MRGRRLAVVALGALGAATGAAVPWPGGVAPTPTALQQGSEAAAAQWEQDRIAEYRSAQEDQVDPEVTIVGQPAIDDHTFDLETLRVYGHRIFELGWRRDMGWGTDTRDRLQPVHKGREPATDAMSCDACHMVGGQDGGGSFTQSAMLFGDGDRASSATRRNPPAMLGAGLVQALAAEMSADLQATRAQALAAARAHHAPLRVPLQSKGVSFGTLVALPDGALDLAGLQGVDEDLIVRPFGWRGEEPTIRRFVEEAARSHLGVESTPLVEHHDRHPDYESLGTHEDPEDPDGDGVRRELEEGSLTMLTVYVALLEVPVVIPPTGPALQARWASGSALFDSVGCAGCHRRSLLLNNRIGSEGGDSTGAPPVTFNLLRDGDAPRGLDEVALFSDLKRHAMGSGLAESDLGSYKLPNDLFLTRPLWGVAETPPYLHDGRAPTLPDAVLAHGGEAQGARDAYAALSADKQADLLIFLLSLTRTPRLRVAR